VQVPSGSNVRIDYSQEQPESGERYLGSGPSWILNSWIGPASEYCTVDHRSPFTIVASAEGIGDKRYTAEKPGEPWERYYARQILRHFQTPGN